MPREGAGPRLWAESLAPFPRRPSTIEAELDLIQKATCVGLPGPAHPPWRECSWPGHRKAQQTPHNRPPSATATLTQSGSLQAPNRTGHPQLQAPASLLKGTEG